MKKIILSFSVIAIFIFYVIYQKMGVTGDNSIVLSRPGGDGTQPIPIAATTTPDSKPAPGETAVPAPSTAPTPASKPKPTPSPTPVPAPTPIGQYKDGIFTGNSVDAFYGIVQVQAIIQGGKLIDVKFLNYPQDQGNSLSISNNSLPQLRTEAIQSQNAKINIVSGATQTSQGFMDSLSSALALAKN